VSAPPVHVLGASIFCTMDQPALASPASRFLIGGLPPEALPRAELVPTRMRRGTSVLCRLFVDVSAALGPVVALGEARLVFGSAWGEVMTALALLEMRHGADGNLSPARFKNSVHNAAAGLVSIACANREPSTAIAAGGDTFAMCLLEAMGWLAESDRPVIVAVAEESPPSLFAPGIAHPPFAAALVLARSSQGRASLGTLGMVRRLPGAQRAELPAALARCPAARILPLLDALATSTAGTIVLGDGDAPFGVDVAFSGQS